MTQRRNVGVVNEAKGSAQVRRGSRARTRTVPSLSPLGILKGVVREVGGVVTLTRALRTIRSCRRCLGGGVL